MLGFGLPTRAGVSVTHYPMLGLGKARQGEGSKFWMLSPTKTLHSASKTLIGGLGPV